jgi:hypothetical protein
MPQELLSKEWDSTGYAFDLSEESKTLRPEERLFLAIIMQAVEDATSLKPGIVRDQARSVLFTSSATPLKDMCLLLDIDPDYLARGVRKMIAEGRTLRREV